MAALYLHNAIHTPDASNSSRTPPSPHKRNVSTVSSTTLRASTSEHSHPTEPLLHSGTSESVAYLDLLSRQPVHPNASQPAWPRSLSLDGDPITLRERRMSWEKSVKQRLRRLKLSKCLLELVLAGFTIYTTVRYFLAYTVYDSEEGQIFALSMGIITGLAFGLLACAIILRGFQPYLLVHRIPIRFILLCRFALHSLASFLIFAPTIVNVALVSLWRHSADPELDIPRRCHFDIDIIWSISNGKCKSAAWGVWLALSLIRLVTTITIIVLYHVVSTSYSRLRRPSRSGLRRSRRGLGPYTNPSESYQSPSMAVFPDPSLVTTQYNHHIPYHHSSDSTLRSDANSKHSSMNLVSQNAAHQAYTSSSSIYSDEDASGESHGHNLSNSTLLQGNANRGHEHEMTNFADRFRSLVSQITRETEEALDFARPDTTAPPEFDTPDSDDFYHPSLPPVVGYDEFGRPYPPDEHVQILNTYIRRMPTIESLGSREVGSITASSMYTNRDIRTLSLRSGSPLSRPPTRHNMLSTTEQNVESRSSSRSNSLRMGVELLTEVGRTNELGEFIDRDRAIDEVGVTNSSHPSTMTYYTATSSGSAPGRANSPPNEL